MGRCAQLSQAPSQRQRMGTAAPPPGVGIGEAHQAEVIRLSLQREEMVVLISDGLEDADTQSQIADFTGQSQRPWPPPWWRRPRPARRTTGRRLQSACAPCRLVQHSTFCLQSLSKHKILHEFFGGNHKICRAGWDLPVSCRHGAFFAVCPRRRQSRADPPDRKFKAPCRRVFRQGRQWDLALHAAPGMKCARIG